MSYLTQMLGLAVQNFFVRRTTGMAVLVVLIRGFSNPSGLTTSTSQGRDSSTRSAVLPIRTRIRLPSSPSRGMREGRFAWPATGL